MKMEKTPRYTQRERNMVLAFAAQYKDVIENKRTDAESNRKKDEVWRQISREFNLRVYHQRSAKQLRQLYKNMKLLLKKDLCGEGKGNRSFMDLLNTLSQPDSMNQCISGQMSPGGYSNSQQQKFDDDYDDSKMPSVGFDSDVILIKSEDISDTEQSQPGGTADDLMDDDDDDDCLSPKDIPEVCLEEEDDEIFATDLRQTPIQHERQSGSQMQTRSSTQNHQPEISIQSVGGGIRVGSIGSLANMKTQHGGNSNSNNNSGGSHNTGNTLLNNSGGSAASSNNNNTSNSALNISHASNTSGASNLLANGASPLAILRQSSDEQARQALLLNGLGLSAVHPPQDSASVGQTTLPSLQRGGSSQNASMNVNGSGGGNGFLHLNGHKTSSTSSLLGNYRSLLGDGHTNGNSNSGNSGNRNDYLMSLAIEERKRKIDLLDAQIKYWQTLTKKLDANPTHQPMPACACHFPGGKVNGLQTPTSSS